MEKYPGMYGADSVRMINLVREMHPFTQTVDTWIYADGYLTMFRLVILLKTARITTYDHYFFGVFQANEGISILIPGSISIYFLCFALHLIVLPLSFTSTS